MSHFNAKTLSFYAIAIGSVLLLFRTVSVYGETKLKAPINIDGSYQFIEADLPSCLQDQQLQLNIEQSGIYLFGNITTNAKSPAQQVSEIPMSGDFKGHQIIMSGKGNLANCDSPLQLTIQGEHRKHNLVGTIKDSLSNSESTFIAKYQQSKSAPTEATKGH
ncbi:hypothetical protein NIES4102_37680 [Chondrocystis sp. NIES-4102]|nr:hypothetical protein NIES4102_37680 [Chondrocystis sp. NIES-4102]